MRGYGLEQLGYVSINRLLLEQGFLHLDPIIKAVNELVDDSEGQFPCREGRT